MLKLVGVGPEVYFNDRWNCIDTVMILLNVVFFFVKTGTKFD